MTTRTRIERLEKRCPARPTAETTVEPDLDFRVAGMPIDDVRRKSIRRLENAITDPRATPEQREEWRSLAERIRAAIQPE